MTINSKIGDSHRNIILKDRFQKGNPKIDQWVNKDNAYVGLSMDLKQGETLFKEIGRG